MHSPSCSRVEDVQIMHSASCKQTMQQICQQSACVQQKWKQALHQAIINATTACNATKNSRIDFLQYKIFGASSGCEPINVMVMFVLHTMFSQNELVLNYIIIVPTYD